MATIRSSAALTDEDIADMIRAANVEGEKPAGNTVPAAPSPAPRRLAKKKGALSRNIMVIGTGDGGCNIASDIKTRLPDIYAIAYNTSSRAINLLNVDKAVIPNAEDGSGKDRSYSKDVFKRTAYKTLLGLVQEELVRTEYEYIFVTTTADGGTGGGSSPNIAKVIADNVSVPVIIVGVYPALSEDAKAQYNTIAWQADVEKTNLPYMIFDNQARASMPKAIMQSTVNDEIVTAMTIITGEAYGNTNISAIDNRDMHMMLIEAGRRITAISSNNKPKVGESLDSYLEAKITNAAQPLPSGHMAIGLFVKGPKAFISSIDTSLFDFREKYGDALLYTHIEEDTDVRISLITAGSGVPDMRLAEIQERYDDIMANTKTNSNTAAALLDRIADPFAIRTSKPEEKKAEADFSGLDL